MTITLSCRSAFQIWLCRHLIAQKLVQTPRNKSASDHTATQQAAADGASHEHVHTFSVLISWPVSPSRAEQMHRRQRSTCFAGSSGGRSGRSMAGPRSTNDVRAMTSACSSCQQWSTMVVQPTQYTTRRHPSRAPTMMTPLPMRALARASVTGACRAAMDPSDTAVIARLMGCCSPVRMKPLKACPMDDCLVSMPPCAACRPSSRSAALADRDLIGAAVTSAAERG